VQSGLQQRTGRTIGCQQTCEKVVPEEVSLHDGLSEEDAVRLALLNNAAFRELLADLGLGRAAVIQARQLTNPDFSVLFPVGWKQLEFTLSVPVETLWLRPRRTKMAQEESQRIAERLVQDGLNLIRDVHVAYADLVLARQRAQLSEENARLRERMAELAEARQRAGTASRLDVKTARIDALLEQEQAARLKHDVELARQRLRNVLGMEFQEIKVEPVGPPPPLKLAFGADALVETALQMRPDLWAAQWAAEAAADKARLARHDYFQVSALLPNLKQPGKNGVDIGPGLKFTVPIFHQNQAAIARAEAELDKAQRACETLREKVALEVRQAHTRFLQAQEDLERWDRDIVPALEQAVRMSAKAYESRSTSLLLMLENTRLLLTAQVRRAEAAAELRRAAAELERSVGWRLFADTEEAAIPEHKEETQEEGGADAAPVPDENPFIEADTP